MAGGPRSATVGFGLGVSAWQYGLNQCVAVVGYLRRAVWPGPVLLDYGFPRPLPLLDAAPSAVLLLALPAGTPWPPPRRPSRRHPAAGSSALLGPARTPVNMPDSGVRTWGERRATCSPGVGCMPSIRQTMTCVCPPPTSTSSFAIGDISTNYLTVPRLWSGY